MSSHLFYDTKQTQTIYEVFNKNGNTFECLITPHKQGLAEYNSFEVICRNVHQPDLVTFILTSSPDGHWMPDNTMTIDPWLAERVGRIIINNF